VRLAVVVLGLVTAQRLGELMLAARNTRRLIARGGHEAGEGHYPFVVAVHAAWLGGLWLLAWNRPVSLLWLGAFLILQALRVWVIASLGERWTTRIVIVPEAPLIRRGPYRWFAHPNYAVVAGEIAVLPLAFGLIAFAAAFSALNAAVLAVRLRAEARGLRGLF
jgi:methyltransferase